ncbi:hypothetical protein J6590_039849 [Homalodisca vitripennis]|nr:hypothetical protein J6590_039849 [Homalodisca vitripennis]
MDTSCARAFRRLKQKKGTGHLSSALHSSDSSINQTGGPKEGYLVWSPSCRIPDLDPWHESIRHLIHREEPMVCSELPPLTRVTGHTLQLIHANAHLYGGENSFHCCYQEITRRDADKFSPKVDDLFRQMMNKCCGPHDFLLLMGSRFKNASTSVSVSPQKVEVASGYENEQNGSIVAFLQGSIDDFSGYRSDYRIWSIEEHLHRVGILQEDPLCRMCDEQEETAEHLLFDCPSIAREQYGNFGSLNKGGEFPQEDLIGCFRQFVELLKSLKCMEVGHPIEEEDHG